MYGLVALVPVTNTNPDLANDPWGENKNTVGLTPDRLLRDLSAAFQNESPDFRNHWHSNPCKIPDELMKLLPKMAIVAAKLDILYLSQSEFMGRLKTQNVDVSWIEVDGLHQAKDMDRVTAAGREVRQKVLQWSTGLTRHAAYESAMEGLAVMRDS